MREKLKLPAVIMCDPKYLHNVGGAIRSLSCWGIPTLIWTGHRVDPAPYERLPREERMKGYRDVTWTRSDRPFDLLPEKPVVIGVELVPSAMCITSLEEHPENAVYIFGPEDGSIPQVMRRFCHYFVYLPTHHCLNLAQAISCTLFHRRLTRQMKGVEPIVPVGEMLHEQRGIPTLDTPAMDKVGWDGK